MNKMILTLVLGLAFSTPVVAAEKFSCDELDGMAQGLDDLGAAFQITDIKEGDKNDNFLADVIKDLHIVAGIEKESDLTNNIKALETAWHKMDSDNFSDSLANVIVSLDRLIKRDCS